MLNITGLITLEQIDEACHVLREKIMQNPRIGLILGSGLGSLADHVQNPVMIPYTEIPHWPVSTVEGHQGRLVAGDLEG